MLTTIFISSQYYNDNLDILRNPVNYMTIVWQTVEYREPVPSRVALTLDFHIHRIDDFVGKKLAGMIPAKGWNGVQSGANVRTGEFGKPFILYTFAGGCADLGSL